MVCSVATVCQSTKAQLGRADEWIPEELLPPVLFTSDRRLLYHALSKPCFLLGDVSALKLHSPLSSFTSLEEDSRGKSIPASSSHPGCNRASRQHTRNMRNMPNLRVLETSHCRSSSRDRPPSWLRRVTWRCLKSPDRNADELPFQMFFQVFCGCFFFFNFITQKTIYT